MNMRFWRLADENGSRAVRFSPSVNKTALPSEYRGQTKAALKDAFTEAGFQPTTQVLLMQPNNEGNLVSEPVAFRDIPDDATYRGRANKLTGKGRNGLYHSFGHK